MSYITTELFQKKCNDVRDILYNTDINNSIVKFIVHSPVGKLVFYLFLFEKEIKKLRLFFFFFFLGGGGGGGGGGGSNIISM